MYFIRLVMSVIVWKPCLCVITGLPGSVLRPRYQEFVRLWRNYEMFACCLWKCSTAHITLMAQKVKSKNEARKIKQDCTDSLTSTPYSGGPGLQPRPGDCDPYMFSSVPGQYPELIQGRFLSSNWYLALIVHVPFTLGAKDFSLLHRK